MSGTAAIARVSNEIKSLIGRVSVWLYQATPDEYFRNLPVAAVSGNPKRELGPPLALNLHYLVTPITGSPDSDQQVLAVAMLALHLTPVLMIGNLSDNVDEEIRISLVSDSLEDRVRLWESLNVPYRLSASYLARTVRITGQPRPAPAVVAETTSSLGEAPVQTAG